MDNPFLDINEAIAETAKNKVSLKCGTVTSTNPFKVKVDGDDEAFGNIKLPKGYTPATGDRVAFLNYDNKYLMIQGYAESSSTQSQGMEPKAWNGINFDNVEEGIYFAINSQNGPSGFSHGLFISFKFKGGGFTTSHNDSSGLTPVTFQLAFNYDTNLIHSRLKCGKESFTAWEAIGDTSTIYTRLNTIKSNVNTVQQKHDKLISYLLTQKAITATQANDSRINSLRWW